LVDTLNVRDWQKRTWGSHLTRHSSLSLNCGRLDLDIWEPRRHPGAWAGWSRAIAKNEARRRRGSASIAGRRAQSERETIELLHKARRIVFVPLIVIISACQSQPVTYYTPPEGMLLKDSANLVGSKVLIRKLFYADEITYVRAIDDLPVEGGSKNYDSPIQLLPGKHEVQVRFVQGTGCAEADFELNVQSRKSYITRSEKLGRESIFRYVNLRIWIEDSDGNVVTNDAVVQFRFCGGGFGLIFI
jgi:hypothetical protein